MVKEKLKVSDNALDWTDEYTQTGRLLPDIVKPCRGTVKIG